MWGSLGPFVFFNLLNFTTSSYLNKNKRTYIIIETQYFTDIYASFIDIYSIQTFRALRNARNFGDRLWYFTLSDFYPLDTSLFIFFITYCIIPFLSHFPLWLRRFNNIVMKSDVEIRFWL